MGIQVIEDVSWNRQQDGSRAGPASVAAVAYSPLQGGPPPAPRFGTLSDLSGHIRKLRQLHGPLAGALRAALHRCDGGVVPLLPLAAESLAAGEECHAGTLASSTALQELLLPYLEALQLPLRSSPLTGGDVAAAPEEQAAAAGAAAAETKALIAMAKAAGETVEFLKSAPSFFLNLWMAACKCALVAAERAAAAPSYDGGEGGMYGTLVTALGGNGITVGLQLSARPGKWFTSPAVPPEPYVPATPIGGAAAPVLAAATATLCGVMGDSMVVDALGFGAQLRLVLPNPDANRYPDLARQVDFTKAARSRALGDDGSLSLGMEVLAGMPGFASGPATRGGSSSTNLQVVAPGCRQVQPIKVGISARELLRRKSLDEEGQVLEVIGSESLQGCGAAVAVMSDLAINLSVLDEAGELGIIGRGVYFVPMELIERAVWDVQSMYAKSAGVTSTMVA